MAEHQRVDPLPPMPGNVIDGLDRSDPDTVREVFRAKHRLAVSVMERPREYQVSYSLGDIHRLTFLSQQEREAVAADWRSWQRRYVRLTRIGTCFWLAAAALAVFCGFAAVPLAAATREWFGLTVPVAWYQTGAMAVALGLVPGLPALLAGIAAPALCDSYLRGYGDGLTRGVNRALHITPESEEEMWEELRQAERLDAGWRAANKRPAAP